MLIHEDKLSKIPELNTYSDDNIIAKIEINITPNFTVRIENKTDEDIEIIWDKSCFIVNNEICGGFTAKGVESLPAKCHIRKKITPTNKIGVLPAGEIGIALKYKKGNEEKVLKILTQRSILSSICNLLVCGDMWLVLGGLMIGPLIIGKINTPANKEIVNKVSSNITSSNYKTITPDIIFKEVGHYSKDYDNTEPCDNFYCLLKAYKGKGKEQKEKIKKKYLNKIIKAPMDVEKHILSVPKFESMTLLGNSYQVVCELNDRENFGKMIIRRGVHMIKGKIKSIREDDFSTMITIKISPCYFLDYMP